MKGKRVKLENGVCVEWNGDEIIIEDFNYKTIEIDKKSIRPLIEFLQSIAESAQHVEPDSKDHASD